MTFPIVIIPMEYALRNLVLDGILLLFLLIRSWILKISWENAYLIFDLLNPNQREKSDKHSILGNGQSEQICINDPLVCRIQK